jgi:hypothetical protein
LPISAARSSRRSASAVTSFELSTRKRSSKGVSRVSSPNRRDEVASAGFRYLRPSFPSMPRRANWRAWPFRKPCSDLRVSGSSVLNSWSMSTAVVVESVPSSPPSSISSVPFGGIRRST